MDAALRERERQAAKVRLRVLLLIHFRNMRIGKKGLTQIRDSGLGYTHNTVVYNKARTLNRETDRRNVEERYQESSSNSVEAERPQREFLSLKSRQVGLASANLDSSTIHPP